MARVNYKGKIQRTMAQYEALTSLEQYADYDIVDHPNTNITNTQMTYALTCHRLFPAGDTYICNDEGTYKKGHTYTIKVDGETKSWEDVTPTPTLDSTPTQDSTNGVTSGGVKSYVDNIVGDIETLLGGI